jgi:hypothetical protein
MRSSQHTGDQGAQLAHCLPTDGDAPVMEGGEQMREGLPVIHLHQCSQRKQAETGILFTFVLKNGGGTAPLGIAGKG